jgi:hypothetical protein
VPAAALQAEVASYVEQFADQLDENGHRLVVRNGDHQRREVLTAAGAVEVKAPRVNDKRIDAEARTFAARDLSGSDYVYLWGLHAGVRHRAGEGVARLCRPGCGAHPQIFPPRKPRTT